MKSIQYQIGLQNDSTFEYQLQNPIENRKQLSQYYQQRKPDCLIVVCEPHKSFKSENTELQQPMFLISLSDTVINLQKAILQGIKARFTNEQNLFLFISNTIIQGNQTMQHVYDKYKNKEDGILYVKYCNQECFGG